MARCQFMLLAAAIAVFAFAASPTSALIEGPGVYYGFELPEPFYNYWNYTSDVKHMAEAMVKNDFATAAQIYTKGKNNRRNETHMRTMEEGAVRNRSGENFFDMYSAFFNSITYLKDLVDPPLYGNGSFAGACCGERAAAVEIYNRLWLVMYAQHEVDAGVRIPAADEATHGFAVVASPVDMADNYWEWISRYSAKACLRPMRDPITRERFAATMIAYRNGFSAMFDALNVDTPAAGAIAAAYKALYDQVTVQFMQVLLVEAKLTVFSPAKDANACNKACLRPAHKAAVDAAWKALGPLVARSNAKSSIAAVTKLLATFPGKRWKVAQQKQLKLHVSRIAVSLGIDFKSQVYKCAV
eukprot:GHRQ01002438.1.p1 GENE.GHRQ01002438.1~~GHRQ01002438.1.p1  ORF type:complete len:356 (+),score=119.88 GHRQ01002438.1:147-1214(+)